MTVYALCRHYDTHGGDDTRVIGLFSTKERAYEEGIKWDRSWEDVLIEAIIAIKENN